MGRLLIDPLASFDQIERAEANDCLERWQHRMGPIRRPDYRAPIDFGLREKGELVAVVCADTLIRPTCGFDRSQAFELSRLCAAGPRLCRLAIRLWTEIAHPLIAQAWGTPWAISYQDATQHSGNLYRFDGWVRLGFTSGGADPRAAAGTVNARRRVIWGWHSDPAEMRTRRENQVQPPRWAA